MDLALNLSPGAQAGGGAQSTLDQLLAILDDNSNCSVGDCTQATNTGTLTVPDLTNNSNPYVQSSAPNQFTISGTLGLVASNANNSVVPTSAGSASTLIYSFLKDPTDNAGILSNNAVFRYQLGAAIATPGLFVNGEPVATRDDTYDAIQADPAVERAIRMVGVTDASIGRIAGNTFEGSVRRIVCIDQAQVTGADYTSAVSLAEEWVVA